MSDHPTIHPPGTDLNDIPIGQIYQDAVGNHFLRVDGAESIVGWQFLGKNLDSPFRNMDPRQLLADITRMIGEEEMGEDINSGRMNADFLAPLLAGFIDGVTRGSFAPTVGGEWSGFNPEVRPLVGTVKLLDGSVLTVTISASD